MAFPRILLLSRKDLANKNPDLGDYLATVLPVMAIVQSDEDRDVAKDIVEEGAIATLNGITAIIADFAGCLAINDDGSVEPIVLPEITEPEPETPLITLTD